MKGSVAAMKPSHLAGLGWIALVHACVSSTVLADVIPIDLRTGTVIPVLGYYLPGGSIPAHVTDATADSVTFVGSIGPISFYGTS